MVLLIRPHEHEGLLTFPELIDALDKAFRDWGHDPTINMSRSIMSDRTRLAVHQASTPVLGRTGFTCHTRGTHLTGAELASGHYHALSFNWDLASGLLDAVVLEQVVGPPYQGGGADIRTAATSMVGTRHLARQDAHTVGIIGSGRQARTHLVALTKIREVHSAKVYSPNPEHRAAYAEQMSKELGIPVQPADSGRAAIEGTDIVLLCVLATGQPALRGEWLEPGQHVTSSFGGTTPRDGQGRPTAPMGRDLDDAVLTRTDVVVINSRQQAQDDLQGDMMEPIERGLLRWEQVHELAELLLGQAPGRTDPRQITLYKNNGAPSLSDVVTISLVAKRARERGLGVEV